METITYTKRKRLEAVTVCVDYSDYLKHFFTHNLKHFDKLTVVTVERDDATIKLCKEYEVKHVCTNRLTERGASFNKGKALNDGLVTMKNKDWILIIDSDIILPSNFKAIYKNTDLKKDCLYGVVRYDCRNPKEWEEFNKLTPKQLKKHRAGFLGRRIGRYKKIVGYFQLFNINLFKNTNKIYPERYSSANISDKMFFQRWESEKRHFLEGINVAHLYHDKKIGENWNGRTTKHFDLL